MTYLDILPEKVSLGFALVESCSRTKHPKRKTAFEMKKKMYSDSRPILFRMNRRKGQMKMKMKTTQAVCIVVKRKVKCSDERKKKARKSNTVRHRVQQLNKSYFHLLIHLTNSTFVELEYFGTPDVFAFVLAHVVRPAPHFLCEIFELLHRELIQRREVRLDAEKDSPRFWQTAESLSLSANDNLLGRRIGQFFLTQSLGPIKNLDKILVGPFDLNKVV